RPRRGVPSRADHGDARSQSRGTGPGRPLRRPPARRADRPHRRRSGRDGAGQLAARLRPRRAGGHARRRPSAPAHPAHPDPPPPRPRPRRGPLRRAPPPPPAGPPPPPPPPPPPTPTRHELLPLLDAIADRDVAALLARQASTLRDEADLLDSLAGALDPTDARALAAAPAALARRAVRRWLTCGYPPEAAAVEPVLAVAPGEAVACDIRR